MRSTMLERCGAACRIALVGACGPAAAMDVADDGGSLQRLGYLDQLLSLLSSSAWHFIAAVGLLSLLIAVILEATADLGMRFTAYRLAIGESLDDPEAPWPNVGIDRAMLDLLPDELAAQLASLANAVPATAEARRVSFRYALMGRDFAREEIDGLGKPDGEPGLAQQARQARLERQLDLLQVRLRLRYRRLERVLALVASGAVVLLLFAGLSAQGLATAMMLMTLAILIPLAAAFMAPLLRELLRNLVRRF
jgi:hypothetical protein